MIIYILIATILFCGYFSKKPKEYYILSMLLLFVFTAFRDVALGDYNNVHYMLAFDSVDTLDKFSLSNKYKYGYEKGYMFLNSVCKSIVNDFRFFQVIYTGIAILLLNAVIKRLRLSDKQKNLFLFTYFCMRFVINNFIILRQNIAVLLIWLIILSDKTKIKKKIVYIIGTMLFHVTSIFNVVFLFVEKIMEKFTRKRILYSCLILSVITLVAGNKLCTILINLIVAVAGNKFSTYLNGIGKENINFIYYLMRIVMFVCLYRYYDRYKYGKKEKLFAISAFAVVLGSINNAIFTRFMEYFMLGLYVTIPLTVEIFDSVNRRIVLCLLYVAMVIILARSVLIFGNGYLLNYRFFLK